MRLLSWLFLLAAMVLSGSAAAQICSLGVSPGAHYSERLDAQPALRAANELEMIYRALCPSGCGRYVLVSNVSAPNALAMVAGPGVTKIAYNPRFMAGVAQQYGPGATIGILAHELGHHIDFNVSPPWMNNSWSRELKADAWAGCALARIGGSTQHIEAALLAIAAFPSPTHPPWQHRVPAVRRGFVGCGGLWLNRWR